MAWLIIGWWCLALAIVSGVIWLACVHMARSMEPTPQYPPAPSVFLQGRVRHMLLEGFSVWRICEELHVTANEVHEVLAKMVREKKP